MVCNFEQKVELISVVSMLCTKCQLCYPRQGWLSQGYVWPSRLSSTIGGWWGLGLIIQKPNPKVDYKK